LNVMGSDGHDGRLRTFVHGDKWIVIKKERRAFSERGRNARRKRSRNRETYNWATQLHDSSSWTAVLSTRGNFANEVDAVFLSSRFKRSRELIERFLFAVVMTTRCEPTSG
jgi:uncharacterized protein VirK/YbjX